jgi:hypothetical protein
METIPPPHSVLLLLLLLAPTKMIFGKLFVQEMRGKE